MTCLVISASDVRRLLPMPSCIDPMADALVTLVSVFPGNHGTEYDQHQGGRTNATA